jgi:ATP-dependent Lhr-like helicase
MHLSTLTHQILASIAQHGGLSAGALRDLLMRGGPFERVPRATFIDLLRRLGDSDVGLIEQAPDGTLMLGRMGERVVEHYSFFAVFQTPVEYRITAAGKTLGSLPIDFPLMVGAMIIFAGRRWRIKHVDDRAKTIEVEPAMGGAPPPFGDKGIDGLHGTVVREMRDILMGGDIPAYLDEHAVALLQEGRAAFSRLGLTSKNAIELDGHVYLFPWIGSIELGTFALALKARGHAVMIEDVYMELPEMTLASCIPALRAVAQEPPPDRLSLAAVAEDKIVEKFDGYLSDELLTINYASEKLDPVTVPQTAQTLIAGLRSQN